LIPRPGKKNALKAVRVEKEKRVDIFDQSRKSSPRKTKKPKSAGLANLKGKQEKKRPHQKKDPRCPAYTAPGGDNRKSGKDQKGNLQSGLGRGKAPGMLPRAAAINAQNKRLMEREKKEKRKMPCRGKGRPPPLGGKGTQSRADPPWVRPIRLSGEGAVKDIRSQFPKGGNGSGRFACRGVCWSKSAEASGGRVQTKKKYVSVSQERQDFRSRGPF